MNGLPDSNNENIIYTVYSYFIYSSFLGKPAMMMKAKLKRDPT